MECWTSADGGRVMWSNNLGVALRACASILMVQAALTTCEPRSQAAAPPDVKLILGDRLGARRVTEAVCSGVPFSKGVLAPNEPMHIQTRDGKAVPTQTRILACWPDGSVRWLLVQFLADCSPNAEAEYFLKHGPGPASAATLSVRDGADRVVVDTGAIQATVSKSDLTVLDDVWRVEDGSKKRVLAGGTPMVFEVDGGVAHSSPNVRPELVAVEEEGPVRATIRVVGWLEGPDGKQLYRLDTRLRFYAGQSYVQGDYTFVCLGKPDVHNVKEIRMELRPEIGPAPRFVLPGGCEGELAGDRPALITVDREMVCRTGVGDDLEISQKPLAGWATVAGAESGLGVAIRDFRHLNPKAIELSRGRVALALWSPRAGEVLRLGRTRAKTHRILFDFRSAGDVASPDRLRAFQEPLIVTTTPEYLCSTDALGTLSPAGAPQTAAYDKVVKGMFRTLRNQRETLPLENGMLHYGDYYHGGYGNKATRGDLEYDTAHACFLLYARSGDRDYYNFAVASNQHFIDMDVNQENGQQRFHGYGDRAESHEAPTTGLEWGHVFTDGPVDAYYFTGDERTLEAVRMIADVTATIADGEGFGRIRGIFAGAERQLGWPLAALCRAYEVTGDKRYLDASAKVVEYVKGYAEDPPVAYQEGKWWRSWMMDGCKPFMVGALYDGLSAYYAITGDEEVRECVVTGLDWLIDHMWHPETGGFVYEFNAMNRGHRHESLTSLNMLVVDAFRFGYEMTGDPRYLSVATRAFWSRVQEMTADVDGKQFSQDTRTAPFTAAHFYRNDITSDNLPPAPRPVKQEDDPPIVQPRAEMLLKAAFEGNLDYETPRGSASGTEVGEISFVTGKDGRAVRVGAGGYARLPAPTEMLRGPGSIEFWLRLHFKKRPSSPGQRAVFHVEGETPLIDTLGACTIYGDLRIRMKDHVGCLNGTAEGDITAWEPNEWHHVVVTWDKLRVKLYLDGKEQTRGGEGATAWDGVAHFPAGQQTKINLGWRFGNWFCPCDIDSLTVYGRALTATEIAVRAADTTQ